jgi:hypothetical protein
MNSNLCPWNAVLPALRYIEFDFEWNPMRANKCASRSVTPIHNRCFILDQIRQCAPSLQCLTLWWHDLRLLLKHSNSHWPSIQQLNILLRIHEKDNPSASLIKRLPTSKAFPQLRYLSFGYRRVLLTPPELVAERILSWFNALISPESKLVVLHVNRHCFYHQRLLPSTSHDMFIMLLKQHVYLRDYYHSPAKIIINSNEEIIIWR